MLTVITPATNRKLTTVENIRSDLGLGADPNPTNASLERLIDQASNAIELFCNRIFARETVRDTYDCRAGEDSLVLSRFPVATFVSVIADGETYAPANYAGLDGGLIVRLDDDGRQIIWGGGQISVEYTAGYYLPGDSEYGSAALALKLPAVIERACSMEVSALRSSLRRDPSLRSHTIDGVGSRSWQVAGAAGTDSGGFANPGVMSLLQPLRVRNI